MPRPYSRSRIIAAAAALLSCFVLAAVAEAGVSPAPRFRVTDLGTLPGGTASFAAGINSAGQVVGISDSGDSVEEGFRTAPGGRITADSGLGQFAVIPPFGELHSSASAINDAGQVVGYSKTPDASAHAFRTTAGGKITPASDLGVLPGRTDSRAFGVNASGQVVGDSAFADGTYHAFRTTPGGKITAESDLGPSAAGNSTAFGINASGQVVGTLELAGSVTHAFRTTATGKITADSDLGTLPGGSDSQGFAINAAGQVVGGATAADGSSHPFRTTANGKITAASDLGTLAGSTYNFATGINTAGQVVGHALTSNVTDHAFFADVTGPLRDLNDLIPAGSGWVLNDAYGINDHGQIVGDGSINGQQHAFLLTPFAPGGGPPSVPLPRAGWTGAATLAALAVCRRLRRRTGPAGATCV